MLNLIRLTFILSTFSLGAMQEKELFPSSPAQYIPASVWYNSKGDLCVMFGCNIIVIDKWHYPEIEDDDDFLLY